MLASGFHWQCEVCAADGYRFSGIVGTIFENTNKAHAPVVSGRAQDSDQHEGVSAGGLLLGAVVIEAVSAEQGALGCGIRELLETGGEPDRDGREARQAADRGGHGIPVASRPAQASSAEASSG